MSSNIKGKIIEQSLEAIIQIMIMAVSAGIMALIALIKNRLTKFSVSKKKIQSLLEKSRNYFEDFDLLNKEYLKKAESADKLEKEVYINKANIYKAKAEVWKEVYNDCNIYIKQVMKEDEKLQNQLSVMANNTINNIVKDINKKVLCKLRISRTSKSDRRKTSKIKQVALEQPST